MDHSYNFHCIVILLLLDFNNNIQSVKLSKKVKLITMDDLVPKMRKDVAKCEKYYN